MPDSTALDNVDTREQTYNDGDCGPIAVVSRSEDEIVRQRAIMIDVDPAVFRGDIVTEGCDSPAALLAATVAPMLLRHPTLSKAEMRCSGTGLHVLLQLDSPIEFHTAGDRQRAAGMTRVIQRCLPSDPNAPGITALTRPVGSKNSKNGAQVTVLKAGEVVSAAEVIVLYEQLAREPFKTVCSILFGSEAKAGCPICGRADKRLGVFAKSGKCYGGCGTVTLRHLYNHFMSPRAVR